MADKPAPGSPDLTPLFVLLLIIIIAGLGSVRSCNPTEPNTGCAQPPTPPPDPARPGPPVVTNLKRYTVQAGVFTTREAANIYAAGLRGKNIHNFILQANGQYVVCVGTFASASSATRLANTLKAQGVENPVVLPPRKK